MCVICLYAFSDGVLASNKALQALHTCTQGSDDRNSMTSLCLVMLYLYVTKIQHDIKILVPHRVASGSIQAVMVCLWNNSS